MEACRLPGGCCRGDDPLVLFTDLRLDPGLFFKTLAGGLRNVSTTTTPGIFDAVCPEFLAAGAAVGRFLFITGYIVAKGISGGIEKACKLLMPSFYSSSC